MSNLSQNELHIRNYKNMSREELLISLLKSKESIAELRRSKDNNAEIEETKTIFNELRNRFSKEKIEETRKKFRFIAGNGKYLKELRKKNNVTEQEKQEEKRYTKKF